MKKVLFLVLLCACTIQIFAQSSLEFLGMPFEGNTKEAFAKKLIERGYKYKAEKDGYTMYSGQFMDTDASIMLVPAKDGEGIKGLVITMEDINPVKLGSLYAEVLQKYMKKYANFKYTTTVNSDGGTETMFKKIKANSLCDFISIESKVSLKNCELVICYGSDLETNSSPDNDADEGIGVDDI